MLPAFARFYHVTVFVPLHLEMRIANRKSQI